MGHAKIHYRRSHTSLQSQLLHHWAQLPAPANTDDVSDSPDSNSDSDSGSNDEILFGTGLIAAATSSKSLPIIVSTGSRR